MSKHPPYACSCCGVANGDMFWDYVQHNKDTLTYGEVLRLSDEFDSYRIGWNAQAEAAREAARAAKPRKSYKRYIKSSPYWEKRKESTNE